MNFEVWIWNRHSEMHLFELFFYKEVMGLTIRYGIISWLALVTYYSKATFIQHTWKEKKILARFLENKNIHTFRDIHTIIRAFILHSLLPEVHTVVNLLFNSFVLKIKGFRGKTDTGWRCKNCYCCNSRSPEIYKTYVSARIFIS